MTFYEGFSTYTITIPMPFAVKLFAEGLQTALETLLQDIELQSLLNGRDGEKAEVQDRIRKSVKLYEVFLKEYGR